MGRFTGRCKFAYKFSVGAVSIPYTLYTVANADARAGCKANIGCANRAPALDYCHSRSANKFTYRHAPAARPADHAANRPGDMD